MRGFLLFVFILFGHIPVASYAAAIHDAAKKGDVAAITATLDAGADVNENDGTATPLYFAVRRGHLAAAKLLIERGADVNAESRLGSALLAAVKKSRIELIRLLLEKGANTNAIFDGDTALHAASTLPCFECLKALVDAGADVNARSHAAETPLHLVRRLGNREMAEYLLAHGVVLPKPSPISAKLAAADAGKGRIVFDAACAHCHFIEPEKDKKSGKIGPNLWGVVGRDKASFEYSPYSDALRAWEGVWSYEDLNVFLSEPMATTPGIMMVMPGVPDEVERVNLISYLRTRSDKPVPLP